MKGDYILKIQVHGYSNPSNHCSMCDGENCCDGPATTTCSGILRCDNEFFFCVKPFGEDLVSIETATTSILSTVASRAITLGCFSALRSETDVDAGFSDFFSPVFLGLPNPMEFLVNATQWEVSSEVRDQFQALIIAFLLQGITLYLDVIDRDSPFTRSRDEFVNIFQINISSNELIAGSGMTAPEVFSGLFDISTIELSFEVECQAGFVGEDCQSVKETTTETPTSATITETGTVMVNDGEIIEYKKELGTYHFVQV